MKVSRTDVITSHIVDSKDPRRFLKLPIKGYLDLLDVTPIESQIAVINAINMPKYRFLCAALSRRQGKTYIANIIAQMVALVPGCAILIMSPNYSLSNISFDLQRGLIKHFDLEVVKDNAKDKIIELSNGSTIRIGSVNQVDSVVGRSYDLIVFDEAALTAAGEDAFNVALKPTLDKDNSKAIFISTPRGKNNWFSKFYQRGFSSEFPSWVSIHATWHDNPRISEDDIKEAKKIMSRAEFEQEYLASFNVFENQIYNFNALECVRDLSDFDTSGMDIIAGMDIGFRDSTALVVAAYDHDNHKFYVLDEYQENEKTTEKYAHDIKEILDKWNVDFVFIDSAAAQTKYDFAQMYDISCTNASKSIEDGIGYCASLIDNNNVIVSENCYHTITMLDQAQWDPRPGLVKEKQLRGPEIHLSDAFRYMLYSFQTSTISF